MGQGRALAKRVVAVDPVEFTREQAMQFGATDTFASMEEAFPAVTEMTMGQMAEVVIMTPGVLHGDLEIKGTIFGSLNPRFDIPNLLSMSRAGALELDELVTNTSSLDDINIGYQAMRDGENIRGVITHAT